MKSITGFIVLLLLSFKVSAQVSSASGVSEKIAQRLKDSLSLTEQQKIHIYAINMDLHQKKMQVRIQHQYSDSLQYHIQRVENTRDSLYKTILNKDKFLIYKSMKRTLISNN